MQPTREGYLKYLVESQVLYGAMEKIMKEAKVDSCKCSAFAHVPLFGNENNNHLGRQSEFLLE